MNSTTPLYIKLTSSNDSNQALGFKVEQDFDLSHSNTMALSCVSDHAVIITDEKQIPTIFEKLTELDVDGLHKPNILILSGGSNVILPNKLSALALLPKYTGIEIKKETSEYIDIEVMAGNNWHELVVECTNKGWYGLENLALIPGLVGASPVQNIGAYGVQLEDCLLQVKAFHIPTNQWHTLSKKECQFAYRDSIFKQNPNTWLISRVYFRLHKDGSRLNMNYGDVATKSYQLAKEKIIAQPSAVLNHDVVVSPVEVMEAIISIRQSKLPNPTVLANTGSFFQNPIIKRDFYNQLLKTFPDMPKYDVSEELVKVPAGWLIDKAGLKGGGIEPILTHNKQALVLTNHAPYKATQIDIARTRDLIINTILERYGIELHPEPVWICE